MIDFSDLAAMRTSNALRLALCAEALVIRGRWEIGTGFDPTSLIADLKNHLSFPKPDRPSDHRQTVGRLTASLSRLGRAAWLFGAISLRSETKEDEWFDLTPVFFAEAALQKEMTPEASAAEARRVMKAALAIAATVRSDDPYKEELKRIARAVENR